MKLNGQHPQEQYTERPRLPSWSEEILRSEALSFPAMLPFELEAPTSIFEDSQPQGPKQERVLVPQKQVFLKQVHPGSGLLSNEASFKEVTHCNCKKTKCVRLYCDCFSKNRICGEMCNCEGCDNRDEDSEERARIIREMELRNPFAFRPKLKTYEKADTMLHSRGCTCKKADCIKNYCECFKSQIGCTRLCKCTNCKNDKLELLDHEVPMYYDRISRKRKVAK